MFLYFLIKLQYGIKNKDGNKKNMTQIFKFWFQIWNQREKLYENHYMSRRILIQSWYKINRHKPIIEDIRSRGPVPGNITVLLLRLNFEKKKYCIWTYNDSYTVIALISNLKSELENLRHIFFMTIFIF